MKEIKTKYIVLAILIFYTVFFIFIPHTDYNPADAGFKVIQVKEFIKNDYRSFAAIYNGERLDPEKKFFPVKPMAAYKVKDEIYYTFPFLITIINTPAYLLFGIYGIILVSMISGLLTIYISVKIARLLNVSEERIPWMLLFLGFASIIPIYSYVVGEYNLTILLATLSVYLVLLAKGKKNGTLLFFLAGLSAGTSVFLRIEMGLFCVLLFLGVVIFKIYDRPAARISALFFSLALCAIVLLGLNYYLYDNIFGLRGIEFLNNAGKSYSAAGRLMSLFSAMFFSRLGIGLFIAWPLFLFLFALVIKENRAELNSNEIKFLLFVILLFGISIPVVVSNRDGSIIGPRFLAPLQPLLIILTFKVLDLRKMNNRRNLIISRILTAYSVAVIIFGLFVVVRFDQISRDVTTNISKFSKNKVVILCDGALHNSVFPLFEDRIIFGIDPSKDWDEILHITDKAGIKDLTVIDFANDKKAIVYPFKESRYKVIDRNFYHGNYRNTIVENIRIY
jgi:hypothetical protein